MGAEQRGPQFREFRKFREIPMAEQVLTVIWRNLRMKVSPKLRNQDQVTSAASLALILLHWDNEVSTWFPCARVPHVRNSTWFCSLSYFPTQNSGLKYDPGIVDTNSIPPAQLNSFPGFSIIFV